MQLLSNLRFVLTSLFLALFIVACGGGSGDASGSGSNNQPSPFVSDEPVSEDDLGSDIDNDGIRDDLQEYLENTYASRPEQLSRARELARYERMVIKNIHDISLISQMSSELLKREICFLRSFSDESEAELAFMYYDFNSYFDRPELEHRVDETLKTVSQPINSNITKSDYCDI